MYACINKDWWCLYWDTDAGDWDENQEVHAYRVKRRGLDTLTHEPTNIFRIISICWRQDVYEPP